MEETQETTGADLPGTEAPETRSAARTVGLVVVVALIVVVVGFAIYGLASHPQATAVVRDLSIILLALVTLVIGLFLLVLIFQLQSLIALLRDEIKPILDSANETASTVRGTTTFVSSAVVRPMINIASAAAAVGQTVKTLASTGRGKKRDETSPPNPVQE